jgi:P27 family predicted phage terminase small subunit
VPQAKKRAGTAIDKRNGERASLPVVALKRFTLPRRSDALKYDVRTQRMWRALFDDAALSSVLSPVDRELVIRWAQAVDDAIKALELARANPVVKGSMGQPAKSPYYEIAQQERAAAEKCEAQIGIGALNRARLGIAILAERASLADLAGRFDGGGSEPDPRLG